MAGSMDERVVSMEFDNRQFEKNVKTSIKTLDDLKESLDFDKSAESLDTLDKKFKSFGESNPFPDMNESVGSLRKGFSSLGNSTNGLISQFIEFAKITVLIQAAEGAVRSLENSIKSLTIAPISAGFDKYTEKIGSIKTIANATGMSADAVNDSLEKLNWFTDETSYNFTDMVGNIGKFTSVGRGLDESINAMQGIATWAAQSGANTMEASRAMYNLSQAMGVGSVKLMDWKSIENAGMATKEFKEQAIAAAEAAGTLKRKGDKLFTNVAGQKAVEVTYSNFNETLSKAWFTADVLMDTLGSYGDFASEVKKFQEEHPQYALAANAMDAMDIERYTKEAKALTDMAGKTTEEVNAKLNEIGEIENIEEKKTALEEYTDSLENDVIKEFAKNSSKSVAEIRKDIDSIVDTKDAKAKEKQVKKLAGELGVDATVITRYIDAMAAAEESLGEKAFKSAQQSKSFKDSIDATKDAVSTGWMNTFQTIFGGLDDSILLWSDVTEILWELFASGAEGRNNALTDWAERLNGRDDLWGDEGVLHNIMDTIIELKSLLGTSFRDVFFSSFTKAVRGVSSQDEAIAVKNGDYTVDQLRAKQEANFWGYEIKKVTTTVAEFTGKIKEFLTNETNLAKIGNILRGVFRVGQLLGSVIGGVFTTIGNIASRTGVFQTILNVLSKISSKIQEIVIRIQNSAFVTKVFSKIESSVVRLYELLVKLYGQIKSFLDKSGLGQTIRDFFNGILEFFVGGSDDVDEQGNKIESKFFKAFGWVKNVKEWLEGIDLEHALNGVKTFTDNFGLLWQTFTGAANGENFSERNKGMRSIGVDETLMSMLETAERFGAKISGVASWFRGIWDSVVGWLESSGILPTLRSWWDGIKTFFGNLDIVWNGLVHGKFGDVKGLNENQRKLVVSLISFRTKLKKAFDKLKGWFDTAITWFSEKWQLLTDWLESTGVLPTLRGWWQAIKDFFANIGLIWDFFVKGNRDVAKNGDLSENQPGVLEKIEGFILKVREFIGRIVSWLESSGILPVIRGAWDKIQELFDNIALLWGYFVRGDKDIDPEQMSEEQLGMLAKVEEFLGKVGGWIDKIKEWLDSSGISSAWESVKGFFGNFWQDVTTLFGGDKPELVEFDDYPTPKGSAGGGGGKRSDSTEAIEKKPGLLGKIFAGFKNSEGNFDLIQGISSGVVGLLELIGSINWSGISESVFMVMVDVINGLNAALGKLEYGNILKVVGNIVAVFWGSMVINGITEIVSTIKAIVKKGKDKSVLEQFTDLLTAIGTALLQLGIAVALIAGSIWLIGRLKDEQLKAAIGVMKGIGIFIAGLIVVVALINAFMPKADSLGKTFKAIGGAFLQISIAIAIMIAAIWLLSQTLDEEGKMSKQMVEAIKIIAGIVVGMAVILVIVGALTKKAGAINISITIATFVGIAILLATVVVCILLLQSVDINKAWQNAGLLGTCLLGLILALVPLRIVKINAKVLATTVAMAVILGILTVAFVLLKDVDGNNIVKIAIAMGIALTAIIVVLSALSVLPAINMIQGAAALAAVLVILAGAVWFISKLAVGVFNDLVVIMSSLAAASVSAELVNVEAIINALNVLPVIALGLSSVARSGADSSKAIALAGAAWDVFDELSLASTSAELVDEDQFHKIFGEDGTGGILQVIQTGMASVTTNGYKAASLGTHVEQLAESLKLVGQAGLMLNKELDDYGNQTYSQGIQNVKDRLSEIQEIVQMATTMGTAGEGEDIKQIDLTTFAEGIANIGAALELYNQALATFETEGANGTAKINSSDVAPLNTENIRAALQTVIGSLTDVALDESQRKDIEGWANLTKSGDGGTLFALGLTNIANAMGTFSSAAADFNNENVDKAVESLGTLADIKSQVENPADYKETINGISAWGDSGEPEHRGSFANAISSMGTAMAAFGESVKDIPSDAVSNATTALSTLAALYDQLHGNEAMLSYFSAEFLGTKLTFGTEGKSVEDVFTDFGNGIGKLGSALATFGKAIGKESYDEDKVKAATGILSDMANMQKSLQEVDFGGSLFTQLIFGQNDLKKLGENMSGLGSRLSTFASELGGFDIDIEGSHWKNISGVLTFMSGIWQDLNNMSYYSEEVDESGQITSSVSTAGYTLQNLATGLDKIRDALVKFNEAMTKVRNVDGTVGKTYTLGDWDTSKWGNITTVLNDLKQLAIDFKNANLSDSDVNLIGTFGTSIDTMFEQLNSHYKGFLQGSEVKSDMAEFINSFASSENINVKAFSSFIENLKGFADAAGTLASNDVEWSDIDNLCTMIERIMGISTDGFTSEAFQTTGITLATNLITGFVSALTSTESSEEGGTSMSSAFETLLATLDSYSDDFFEKGKAAGSQYAAGFQEGLGGINPTSSLTPIVDMDDSASSGGNSGNGGIAGILQSMNLATSADMATVISRLETINRHFDNPINVNDAHSDIVRGIEGSNGYLKNIETKVNTISSEVNNLKVYIDSKILVGAIVGDMDAALGARAYKRVSP